ncbi:MAG: DUF3552 domain-containing protein, partial [Chloroflexi bacterium]|nr:DUF3552 domain-containing protein [Chloroflexota bacterium]
MLLIGGSIGFGVALFIYRTSTQNQISRLEAEWQLKVEAIRTEHKELRIQASDEALRIRSEAEVQIREARQTIRQQEERLNRKEEVLDRKVDGVERRERQIQQRERTVEQHALEAEQLKQQQRQELERISGLSEEQAREIILQRVEVEARD